MQVIDRLSSLAITPAVADLLEQSDLKASWATLPMDRQRAVIDTLMKIELHSPGRGVRTFDPATVGISWRAVD